MVRLGSGTKPGILAHGPEPAAVHRRLDAPGEGELTGFPEIASGIPAVEIGRNAIRINHIWRLT